MAVLHALPVRVNVSGSSQYSGLWWMALIGMEMVKSFVECTPFQMQSSLQIWKVLK